VTNGYGLNRWLHVNIPLERESSAVTENVRTYEFGGYDDSDSIVGLKSPRCACDTTFDFDCVVPYSLDPNVVNIVATEEIGATCYDQVMYGGDELSYNVTIIEIPITHNNPDLLNWQNITQINFTLGGLAQTRVSMLFDNFVLSDSTGILNTENYYCAGDWKQWIKNRPYFTFLILQR